MTEQDQPPTPFDEWSESIKKKDIYTRQLIPIIREALEAHPKKPANVTVDVYTVLADDAEDVGQLEVTITSDKPSSLDTFLLDILSYLESKGVLVSNEEFNAVPTKLSGFNMFTLHIRGRVINVS